MKKFWAMFCVGIAVGAYAGSQTVASETQIATATAPTSGDDFTSANSVSGLGTLDKFKVMVCSVESNGLQAVGTLKAYALDERTGLVSRNKQVDLDMTTQEAARCIQFPDQTVGVPTDKFKYVANALKTTDGGTLLPSDAGTGAFIIYYRTWRTQR